MKIGAAFSSHLKAEDIGTAQPVVQISDVRVEEVGQDKDKERKPILYFEGKDKSLVLNKTNATTLTEIFGTDETDEWIGQRIRLFVAKVDFQGRKVDGIRIKAFVPGAAVQPARRPVPPPPPPDDIGDDHIPADDSDVPF